MTKRALLFLFVSLLLVITGCGIPFRKKLDMYIQAEQYKEASALIEAEKTNPKEGIYGGKNELLYFFDKGAMLQALAEYKGSSDALQKADDKIDALYTKSVVDESLSLITDENAIEYRGEDFERVMVNILKALNFMYAGDFDGARVEVKRIDHKLRLFTDEYGEKCIYNEDAFARYLAGFAYEAIGELDNAYIDYKKSLKTYEKYQAVYGTAIPSFIKPAVLRVADALKYRDDIAEFEAAWGEKPAYTPSKELKTKGEVMLVVYNGMSPVKYDSNSWPKYQSRGIAVTEAVAEVDGKQFKSETAQDVAVMAAKNLDNRVGLMLAKKVASSVVKGVLSGLLGGKPAKEYADIRCWRTIPSQFDIIRMELKPGKKEIKVHLYPADGGEPRDVVLNTGVTEGGKKVIPVYAYTGTVMPPVVEKQ